MVKQTKDNWIDALLHEIAGGKQYLRPIQKCIDHMGASKKLYKYYDLDSPYTLTNIENFENFYNNPTAFNDPFDCNIGISADQLIRLCMPGVYSKIYNAELDPAVRAMIEAIIFGDAETYDDDSEESVIAACLECPEIADIVSRAQAGEEINDALIADALFDNPSVLAAMLSKYPGIAEQENKMKIEEQIKLVAMSSTKIIRQLLSKAAENQPGETREIMAIMGEEGDLLKRIQKIARLLGHTEDDAKINTVYEQLENMVKQMHSQLGEVIGITCFSETPNNMLMWSHYANRHTGICVEYDFSRLFSTAADTLLLPVTYDQKRPLFPLDQMVVGSDGKIRSSQPLPADALVTIIKALTIKSDVWSYEREWRHIMFTKSAPNRLVKLPIISKIIMGMNISTESEQKVIAVARKRHIPVFSTHMKSDKYEMVISGLAEKHF